MNENGILSSTFDKGIKPVEKWVVSSETNPASAKRPTNKFLHFFLFTSKFKLRVETSALILSGYTKAATAVQVPPAKRLTNNMCIFLYFFCLCQN